MYQQPTLFKFFSKTNPSTNDNNNKENNSSENGLKIYNSLKKQVKPPAKRKQLIIDSEEEDDSKETADIVAKLKKTKSYDSSSQNEIKGKIELFKFDGEKVNKDNTPATLENKQKKELIADSSSNKRDLISTLQQETISSNNQKLKECKFLHQTLEWLNPQKRKDSMGRNINHEEYDPRTLYIPEEFLKKVTPALKQWWTIKSQRFDCVIFFKVGKFYELYHMDAVLSVKELGLTYMRGGAVNENDDENTKIQNTPLVAHSGFPEIACGRYMDSLVEKGYKVCRVEQTETVQAMEQRRSSNTKDNGPGGNSKLVKREVCRVMSRGTKTFSFFDALTLESVTENRYLIALAEAFENKPDFGVWRYGVCCLDTTVGKFYIGEFSDDDQRSNLRTLLTCFPPVEMLLEKGRISKETIKIIDSICVQGCLKQYLIPGKEFWDGQTTLQKLKEAQSMLETNLGENKELHNVTINNSFNGSTDPTNSPSGLSLQEAIKSMVDTSDILALTPSQKYRLLLKALGACVWYLNDALISDEFLTMTNNVYFYQPPINTILKDRYEGMVEQPDDAVATQSVNIDNQSLLKQKHMILDDITLDNLEVVPHASIGSGALANNIDSLTLYDRLATGVSTPMGRRLLKKWLCAPLISIADINHRLDALEAFAYTDDINGLIDLTFISELTGLLKPLPDLERLLQKVHSTSYNKPSNHPDTRAVMFEEATFSKRKIEDFVNTLNGFDQIANIVDIIAKKLKNTKSEIIQKIVNMKTKAGASVWKHIRTFVQDFMKKYDFEAAKTQGVLVPEPGIFPLYDEANVNVSMLEKSFKRYLKRHEDKLGCKLSYVGTAKNRYQIEVPEGFYPRVPEYFEIKSQRKGAKRYWTKEIEEMLKELIECEYRRDQALSQSMRKIFARFDQNSELWNFVLFVVSQIDIFLALAKYSCGEDNATRGTAMSQNKKCRPQLYYVGNTINNTDSSKEINNTNKNDAVCPRPFIKLIGSTHPCLSYNTFSGGNFIPNDISINFGDQAAQIVITGPNMGGKSTLLRQVGLTAILAQLGCYVPAESCELSIVDRIFTRLGAKDNIIKGESTFFVELKETSTILTYATPHSLVLIDELGRGTATYDGVAIADSVLRHIKDKIKCRTMFSTHYHSLVDALKREKMLSLAHMACMVETNDEDFLMQSNGLVPTNETVKPSCSTQGNKDDVITFLYKLVAGACPNSYGFHAALLAGMPQTIVNKAYRKAKDFERDFRLQSQFDKMVLQITTKGNDFNNNYSQNEDNFNNMLTNLFEILS